jgi:hypothetical protein
MSFRISDDQCFGQFKTVHAPSGYEAQPRVFPPARSVNNWRSEFEI